MMHFTKPVILFLTIISITLSGCSPLRKIIIENESSISADFRIIANENSPFYITVINNVDTVKLQLRDTLKFSIQPKTNLTMYFGTGTWPMNDNLENLVSVIEYFEIKHPNTRISLSDSVQIREYLSKHYSNPSVKSAITVRIK